jgi:hypothetical protein
MNLSKVASLASVLRRDPAEFVARVTAIAEGCVEPLRHARPAYGVVDWPAALQGLAEVLGQRVQDALAEASLSAIEKQVDECLAGVRAGPIDDRHNGDLLFGRCCYAVIRAVRPRTVIETGVAHGVSTAFMLAALDANGAGELHSIDLPPHDAGADQRVGACVPQALRARWSLHRGLSRSVLPSLVSRLPAVDVFVHDSQHTYRNMSFEFEAVWSGTQVIIADDVERNAAFEALTRRSPAYSAVVRQDRKDSLFGVLVR